MRMVSARFIAVSVVVAGALTVVSCSEKIEDQQPALGGSCLGCHDGITQIHPFFALSCTDCHGGNDDVPLPANLNIRDSELMKLSHVLPKDPEMWWPNGIDDNGDGKIDEQGEFFDGRVVDQDGNAGLKEGRLANRNQLDSEPNSDLNYLRFLNPGDLRVAQVGCGNKNRQANDAMICHAEVVYDMRRSIMTTQAGVVAGATYGNAQLPQDNEFRDLEGGLKERFAQRNPRIGRVGYTFDYDVIDRNFLADENRFDSEALLANAAANQDPEDDLFEAVAGPLLDDGSDPLDPGPGLTRTGQKLKFFEENSGDAAFFDNRSVEVLENIQNSAYRTFPEQGTALELRIQRVLEGIGIARESPVKNAFDGKPIGNPVDNALRSFRAYHPMNYFSPADNFGFVDFFTSPNEDDPPPLNPNDVELRGKNNPFGRFRPSGCTACHVPYRNDGKNTEPIDRTVADNGRQPETALPFGIRTDLGQRPYADRHEIKRSVPIAQCANCHGFVTRVDYAVNGKYEQETDFTNIEQVNTIGPFSFTTPNGTTVNFFDNLAHYKNGRVIFDGEGLTEDLNNNGELDPGEDANNNGQLDIPDRTHRSDAFDGRQSRLIYGGASGSILLKDIHVERGFACVDCHYLTVHGDGNIYTRNWDTEPLECEDCHGTSYDRANLKTSGPNGGDDLKNPLFTTPFGKPWFEEVDGEIIQHSRTIPGLSWTVPQLVDESAADPRTAYAKYAHEQPFETGPDLGREDEARGFAHMAEQEEKGGLECYSCHSSWQPNCLTCHLKMDVAKPKQEIWWGDDDVEDVFFQLFSYTRSPFYLGRSGDVEGNKISTHRSTMQAQVTVVAGGKTLADNVMFSTQNNLSSMVSNPYFPHTVRTTETKSCARCHTLKLDIPGKGLQIANDHFITETTGQGSGRYMNVGDWALAATANGFDQLDIKKEVAGDVVFPGFDLSDGNAGGQLRRVVNFPSGVTRDVALVRGVSFENGSGDVADIAIVATDGGVKMVDVTGRDNVGLPPTEIAEIESLGAVRSIDVVDAAASQSTRFIAVTDEELCTIDFRAALEKNTVEPLIDPDPDDPLEFDENLIDERAQGTVIVGTCLPHGKDLPTKVRLHGKSAVVTHARGITVYALAAPDNNIEADLAEPLAEVATFETQKPALDVVTAGRFAYVATGEGGVEIFDVGPIVYPLFLEGGVPEAPSFASVATALVDLEQQADSRGVAIYGSKLLVADGRNGLRILDVSVPADPRLEETILVPPNGGAPLNQASAVVVATEPSRSFALVADGTNGVRAVNITPVRDYREQLAAAAEDALANGVGGSRFRGLLLSPERWDPLTPFDPKNVTRQVFTFPTSGAAVAIAKGYVFDSIADKSGRRLRDGWMLGHTSLDELTVARMRSVVVREVQGTVDIRGDGLGCVVRDGDQNNVPRDPQDNNRCMPVQSR